MSQIIIFDFEVFRYNTLLGCLLVEENKQIIYYQEWNLEKIKEFYYNNKNSIWVGHNNFHYDNIILSAIINNKNPYEISKSIIENKKGYLTPKLKNFYSYDLMDPVQMYSLKSIEAWDGENISETEVDFEINRNLNEEEKLKVELYNRDDLNRTYKNFLLKIDEFNLRLGILKEFDLPLDYLSVTGTKLASTILKSTPCYKFDNRKELPKNLILKNKEIIDFFQNEKYKTNEKIKVNFLGIEHIVASGGIHGARKKCHYDKVLYLDVSGYYNLIMLNYDLLPRGINKEGRQLYEYMYHEQLKLKGVNDFKRQVYKKILLSVFGAMKNEYCDFYDLDRGFLVTIFGELFISDLLEKFEENLKDKIELVQSNTDGIILYTKNNENTEKETINIVENWCNRTGFVIKPKHLYNFHQRDVNNYFYTNDKGELTTLGEAVKGVESYKENIFYQTVFQNKLPLIINISIVNYFLNHKLPSESIKENLNDLRLYQFICKKMSYDYLLLVEKDVKTDEILKEIKLQNVNRVFVKRFENNKQKYILKVKNTSKGLSSSKYTNLPENVFVYNGNIKNSDFIKEEIVKDLDLSWYINKVYDRIFEFIDIKKIKDIKI